MSARWTRPRAIVQIGALIILSVGGLVAAGYMVGMDSKQSPLETGRRACADATRALTSAIDHPASASIATGVMANAGADLALVAGGDLRLSSIVSAIERSRIEVASGQAEGPSGRALILECQNLG